MRSLFALPALIVLVHGFHGTSTTYLRVPHTTTASSHGPPLACDYFPTVVWYSTSTAVSELRATNQGSETAPVGNSDVSTGGVQYVVNCVKRICLSLARKWSTWKKFVRRTRRCTVYVLECQNNKYYVGSTTNKKKRFKQHQSERGGSKWTRLHKPIRVIREYNRIPSAYTLGMEAQVTAETMLKFGINNVRGAMFAEPREYTHDDIRALTGFLGHYNNLGYQDVEASLQRDLTPSRPFSDAKVTAGARRKKKKRKFKDNRCYNCGQEGHWAYQCPEAWGSLSKHRPA